MRLMHLLLFGMLVNLFGCSQLFHSDSFEFDLASQPTVYIDQYVEKSAMQVYVHPTAEPETPPAVLFIPFRVTQKMSDAYSIGESISQQFWHSWLQNGVFPIIEWSPMQTAYRQDIALALGRARGADYVVGGVITYLIDGGAVGDSYFSVKVDIHEVKTGNLMWSMAQSGMMRQKNVEDYIIVAIKRRMPTDPLAIIIQTIAEDMGKTIRDFNSSAPIEKSWYYYEKPTF